MAEVVLYSSRRSPEVQKALLDLLRVEVITGGLCASCGLKDKQCRMVGPGLRPIGINDTDGFGDVITVKGSVRTCLFPFAVDCSNLRALKGSRCPLLLYKAPRPLQLD